MFDLCSRYYYACTQLSTYQNAFNFHSLQLLIYNSLYLMNEFSLQSLFEFILLWMQTDLYSLFFLDPFIFRVASYILGSVWKMRKLNGFAYWMSRISLHLFMRSPGFPNFCELRIITWIGIFPKPFSCGYSWEISQCNTLRWRIM